jgi:hypothetical protein
MKLLGEASGGLAAYLEANAGKAQRSLPEELFLTIIHEGGRRNSCARENCR